MPNACRFGPSPVAAIVPIAGSGADVPRMATAWPDGYNGSVEPIVLLTGQPLDPEALRRAVEAPDRGGVVVFCGEVRSVTHGAATHALEYEAYTEMALAQMREIALAARDRWNAAVAVAHRTGRLVPGEIAVVAVAACGHRAEAFACCQFLIDQIKADVPIWKRDEPIG